MKAGGQSEHKLQSRFMDYLTVAARRDLFWFAVPNAGLRSLRVGAMMKAEGLKPGVADICFMLPDGKCAWLEMKTESGRLSPHQEGFKHRCAMLGHPWAMARSLDEAIEIVRGWGVLREARAPEAVA